MNPYGGYGMNPMYPGGTNPAMNAQAANAVNNIMPGNGMMGGMGMGMGMAPMGTMGTMGMGMGGTPIPPLGATGALNNAMSGGMGMGMNPYGGAYGMQNQWNPNYNSRY